MEEVICPDCKKIQYSPVDCEYVKLFNTGWCCDKLRWAQEKLSLEEFKSREKQAYEKLES